ncbi:MAG: hypothetical protein KDD69_06875 [Bdellovibrionales bacterium]|nr:hypothetical protein [Bdellovibrionales bacterium]
MHELQYSDSEAMKRLLHISRRGVSTINQSHRTGAKPERVVSKEGGEFALQVDLDAQQAIATSWRHHLPDIRLVDEECPETHEIMSRHDGSWYGLSDPLDGTAAFLNCTMMPQAAPGGAWGTTLGLMNDGVCYAGVMHQPALNLLFYGSRTLGVQLVAGREYRTFVAQGLLPLEAPLRRARAWGEECSPLLLSLPASSKMSRPIHEEYVEIRRCLYTAGIIGNEVCCGCAVGNTAGVILGQIDAYVNVGGGLDWDLAVPFLLAELAGCVTGTLDGKKITWRGEKQQVFVARDALSAERLLNAINK